MKSLLTDLEAVAGKTAYQSYTMKHGIETMTVLVPLKNAKVFEVEFAAEKTKTKEALLEVVHKHAGKIKE